MSLRDCIPHMVERGELDNRRAKRMRDLFDQLDEEYRKTMGPEAAASEAGEETLRQIAAEAALKKRQTLLQAASQKRAVADLKRYKGESGYAAIRAMMDDDLQAPYENVTRRSEAIVFQAQADIADFIERHRRDFLGRPRDQSGLDDVMRELHGQVTGNARARTFGNALANVFEGLRQRYNAAGGNIGKRKDWGFVHRHDALKVRRVPYEQWRADVREGLDIAAMRDPETGGPMSAGRLEEILRGTYEAIRTGGLLGEPDDPFKQPGKLANARAWPRVLVFRDGDAWLAYHRMYGTGNVFNAIMAHIHDLAGDIAAIERFGPNPDATVKYLLDSVDRAEAQSSKALPGAVAGVAGGRWRTEQLWKHLRGEFNAPVFAEGFLEKPSYFALATIQGTRDLLSAALLGSSPISAITDVNTQRMARALNGLPEAKVLMSYLRQLNPASARDRKLAIRLGLGMRDASRSLLGLSRYIGDTHGPTWTSVVADDVLRLAGLNKFTEAGQRAFGLDFLGTLGDERATRWEGLPKALREGMERYGISEGDWDVIRAAEPERVDGAEWVNPRAIGDRAVADRVYDMVLSETARAVQETSVSARATINAGTRPGTVAGEFLRNSFQFKGFAVSFVMQQAQVLRELGGTRALSYGAQLFIGMTLFGAASIQLREIAKGRDPRPMDNAEFWLDAVFQGGGLGLFGDLVGTFKSDRIDSLAGFLLGPFYGLAKDVKAAAGQAIPRKRKDGSTRPAQPGKAALGLARRYTPGGNLWYLRLAFEREVLDRAAAMVDPDYMAARQRVEQHARDNGQQLWWRPGQDAPDRAPDLRNAAGARR